MRPTRIYYLCRVNTYFDQKRLRKNLHIGPAYQKLCHVANAVRSAGGKLAVVTVPVCNQLSLAESRVSTVTFKERNVPFLSLGILSGRLSNRIFAFFAFAVFCAANANKQNTFILYNFFPEYLLSAFILRLSGNPAFIDIEDAPVDSEAGLIACISRLSFKILRRLGRESVITVSRQVEERFQFKNPLVIYGATPAMPTTTVPNLLDYTLNAKTRLIFIYGGSLQPETGIDIFCDALNLLALTSPLVREKVSFLVTGFGGESKMQNLKKKLEGRVALTVLSDLSFDSYCHRLRAAHVGLCLKVPGTEMADTTFPSKIVELLRERLLLITTPVSDVPRIFDSTQAIILSAPYAQGLCDAVVNIATDPIQYLKVAENGIAKSQLVFSYDKVGDEFLSFITRNRAD